MKVPAKCAKNVVNLNFLYYAMLLLLYFNYQ